MTLLLKKILEQYVRREGERNTALGCSCRVSRQAMRRPGRLTGFAPPPPREESVGPAANRAWMLRPLGGLSNDCSCTSQRLQLLPGRHPAASCFARSFAGSSPGLAEPYSLQGHSGQDSRARRTEPTSFLEPSVFFSAVAFQIERRWGPTWRARNWGPSQSNFPDSVPHAVCLGTLVFCE